MQEKIEILLQNILNMDRAELSSIVLLSVAVVLALVVVLIAFIMLRKIESRKHSINFALPSLKGEHDMSGMRTTEKKVKKSPKKIDVTKYVEANTESDPIESVGNFESLSIGLPTQQFVGNRKVVLPTITVEREPLSDFDDTLDEIQSL